MLTLVIKEAKDEKNSFSKFPQVGRYNHTTMRQIKDCREDGNFTCFLLPRKEKNNIFALFPFLAGNLSLYIDDFLLSSFFFSWLFLFLSFLTLWNVLSPLTLSFLGPFHPQKKSQIQSLDYSKSKPHSTRTWHSINHLLYINAATSSRFKTIFVIQGRL